MKLAMITINPGSEPWHPTDDSEMIREWDHWNNPLMGVIRQNDCDFLFRKLNDPLQPAGVWKYVQLNELELRILDKLEGDSFVAAAQFALVAEGVIAASVSEPSEHVLAAVETGRGELVTDEAIEALQSLVGPDADQIDRADIDALLAV